MKKYFLHSGAGQEGPFNLEELRAKKITLETYVWFQPMTEWKKAGEIDELKPVFVAEVVQTPQHTIPAANTAAADPARRVGGFQEYEVVWAGNPAQLSKLVNDQLKNGWQPLGGIAMALNDAANANSGFTYCQALVK